MNTFFTAMEQTMAQLIQFFNGGQIDGQMHSVKALFSQKEHCSVCLEECEIFAGQRGVEKALAHLKQYWDKYRIMLFTSSPAYRICENSIQEETGQLSCDVFLYVASKQENTCELRMTRMDIMFFNEGNCARITDLSWYLIQSMEPWKYRGTEPGNLFSLPLVHEQFSENTADSKTFIELKKLNLRLWDRLLYGIDDLFTDSTMAENFKNYFKSQDFRRPPVMACGMPVITVAGGQGNIAAEIEMFRIKSGCDFPESNEAVERIFYKIHLRVIKDSVWKIKDYEIIPEFYLPDTPYIQGIRYDKASKDLFDWKLYNTSMAGIFPEDYYQIENILNAWVYSLRRGNLGGFARKYMDHKDFEPVMYINSNDRSRRRQGMKDILAQLDSMDTHFIFGMYSYHTATTPLIEISEDGKFARGTWFDHSATNMYSASLTEKDQGQTLIPYMVFIARYVHEFKKIDGKWYLSNFYWEPLINLNDWQFDHVHSDGFVRWAHDCYFPWAFEKTEMRKKYSRL